MRPVAYSLTAYQPQPLAKPATQRAMVQTTCFLSRLFSCRALTRFSFPDRKRGAASFASLAAPFAIDPRRLPTLPRARPAVPSAIGPFTSVFGMGTGVSSLLWPPGKGVSGRARKKPTHSLGKPVPGNAPSTPAGAPAGRLLFLLLINGQASRPVSGGPLSASPRLHARPIEVVVCHRPSARFRGWENLSRGWLGA